MREFKVYSLSAKEKELLDMLHSKWKNAECGCQHEPYPFDMWLGDYIELISNAIDYSEMELFG